MLKSRDDLINVTTFRKTDKGSSNPSPYSVFVRFISGKGLGQKV